MINNKKFVNIFVITMCLDFILKKDKLQLKQELSVIA